MDYNDPSRRQYAQNPYAAQQQSHTSSSNPSQYATPGGVERFRQSSYVHQSPTVPSTGRASSDAQVYGFGQGSQYASVSSASAQTMGYAADLQSADVPRQQDSQQYGQYGSTAMYGLASQSQQATQSPYDVSRYTQRPSTASDTVASQFGGNQYYLAGGSVPTSATMADLATPQLSSQYQSAYAQAAPSSTVYGSAAMLDPTSSSAYSAYGAQYTSQSASQPDQAFNQYKAHVRTIFSHVREGSLRDVGDILMAISQYLLGNAEGLGLTRDDDNMHDERIRLWDEFNRAWLVTLQAQFDMTEEWIRTQQPIREPRSVMQQPSLEMLSRELVRLCDSVEKHGLVDYQMGVAEEEIMDLLLRCLSQLDPPEESTPPEGAAESSSSALARSR